MKIRVRIGGTLQSHCGVFHRHIPLLLEGGKRFEWAVGCQVTGRNILRTFFCLLKISHANDLTRAEIGNLKAYQVASSEWSDT